MVGGPVTDLGEMSVPFVMSQRHTMPSEFRLIFFEGKLVT